MDLIKLRDQLIAHEGLRLQPYTCPAGKTTIGVGRNLDDRGISRDEAMMMLTNDISEAAGDVVQILGNEVWDKLGDVRQRVLVDMRFNLGHAGLLRFKRMLQSIRDGRYKDAAEEMSDSKWYLQAKSRGKTLVRMMREG